MEKTLYSRQKEHSQFIDISCCVFLYQLPKKLLAKKTMGFILSAYFVYLLTAPGWHTG